jgi:hypothetical protein
MSKELEKAARNAVRIWKQYIEPPYRGMHSDGSHVDKAMQDLEAALPDPRDELCEAAVNLVDALQTQNWTWMPNGDERITNRKDWINVGEKQEGLEAAVEAYKRGK